MDEKRKNGRYHPDYINSTVKHDGGKLQVWGCMAANGVGTLNVVKGRLDTSAYVQLICHTLKEDGRRLCGNTFIFQQEEQVEIPLAAQKHGFNEKVLKFAHGRLRVRT